MRRRDGRVPATCPWGNVPRAAPGHESKVCEVPATAACGSARAGHRRLMAATNWHLRAGGGAAGVNRLTSPTLARVCWPAAGPRPAMDGHTAG